MKTGLIPPLIAMLVFAATAKAQELPTEQMARPGPARTDYLQCLSLMETSLQKTLVANMGVEKVPAAKAQVAALQCSVGLSPRIQDGAIRREYEQVEAIYMSGIRAPSTLAISELMRSSQLLLSHLP